MVNLPKKKVGIISCGGEELAEGTISRVATRIVLERLRPDDTVTLCLPLFLSGDENERSFARVYPTIAVDGCDKLCAKRATEKFSAPVAGSIVVTELADRNGWIITPERRNLGVESMEIAEAVGQEVARKVDAILGGQRPSSSSVSQDSGQRTGPPVPQTTKGCSCGGGGLPITQIEIDGDRVGLVALEALFEQARETGLAAGEAAGPELLTSVALYNYVPRGSETQYTKALASEYARFLEKRGAKK